MFCLYSFLFVYTILCTPSTLTSTIDKNASIPIKRKPPTHLEIGVLTNASCEKPVSCYDEVEV